MLASGALLALVCAYVGDWLTPLALARWAIQNNDENGWRAAFAMIGVRHLPIFLIAVALGNLAFTALRDASPASVFLMTCPYMAYVLVTAVSDSLAASEPAFSWLTYEPSYFIWPHFVALPVGLLAASRMVRRRFHLKPSIKR